MARLTTAERNALPNSAFAGPDRSYPINDPSHARNALARASQNAGPALQEKIEAKVHKKYPSIGKKRKSSRMDDAMASGIVSQKRASEAGY